MVGMHVSFEWTAVLGNFFKFICDGPGENVSGVVADQEQDFIG